MAAGRGSDEMGRGGTSVVASVARAARGLLTAPPGGVGARLEAGLAEIGPALGAASIAVLEPGGRALARWPALSTTPGAPVPSLPAQDPSEGWWLPTPADGGGPRLFVPAGQDHGGVGAVVVRFPPGTPRPPHDVDDVLELFGDMVGQALGQEASVRKLAEREHRHRILADAAFEGILIHRGRRIVDVNEAACTLLGYPREQLLGSEVPGRYVAPECVDLVVGHIVSGCEGTYEVELLRSDGERVPVAARGRMIDTGPTPTRVVALRDVRPEREQAAQLLEAGERMRALLETAFEGFVVSRRGFVLDANEGFARMCGYTLEEVLGMSPGDVTTSESAELILRNIINKVHEPYVVTGVRKDGTLFPMEIQGSECFYRGELVRITGFRDLTDKHRKQQEMRQLEERMQQAQKLESLGMLAGGIAHDFNNLLATVLGNADLALQAPQEDPEPRFLQIRTAALRASDLTRQMLSYAGESRFEPQDVRLDRVVSEMAELMRSGLGPRVRFEFGPPPEDPRVFGDPTQVGQVVLNLLTNASEALQGAGGTIRLRFEASSVGASLPDEDPLDLRPAPGDYLALVVEDDGPGMSPGTRQRMFDPFFTTKFAGRGLGLASVLGIVKAHGGGVQVRSTPGLGTLIRVLLPRSTGEAEPSGPHSLPPVTRRAEGHVLLVDDDDDVRLALRDMLVRVGMKVTEACDGEEGVRTYLERPGGFDLVVLDLAMPGMGGEEAFDLLVGHDPGVRVLFSSGFEPPPRVLAAMGHPRRDYLRKPYRFRTLLEHVTTLLSVA